MPSLASLPQVDVRLQADPKFGRSSQSISKIQSNFFRNGPFAMDNSA